MTSYLNEVKKKWINFNSSDKGVGNLLLVIDSKNDAIEELATFKEDFGGWTADNMETIKLKKEEMPQEKPVDNDGSTGQGGGEDDTGNEDNAEQSKYVSHNFAKIGPHGKMEKVNVPKVVFV